MSWNPNRTEYCSPAQKSDFGCAVCMRTATVDGRLTGVKMKSCTGCSSARQYCSKRCFKKDWEEFGHRDECKLFVAQDFDIDDPKQEAKLQDLALKLKDEAKALHAAERYKEAISKYAEIKVLAIKIRDKARKRRLREIEEEVKKCALPKYLKGLEDIDPDLIEELKVCHRSDALEYEMMRLSAVAASNTAISYNKLNETLKASGAAREALRLDPSFAEHIMPQIITCLEKIGPTREGIEMANRFSLLEEMLKKPDTTMPYSTILFQLKTLSYNQFVRKCNQRFYDVIDNERKKFMQSDVMLFKFLSFAGLNLEEKPWASVTAEASLVPFDGRQWVTLGIQRFHHAYSKEYRVTPEYRCLRLQPADLRRSGDEVHFDLHCDKPGTISHVGSLEALKNTHREIILFVNDLEREGLRVTDVSVGAGLFNLLPVSTDPQKHQRKHRGKADKYVLAPGHFIPEHCQLVPAANHIRPK